MERPTSVTVFGVLNIVFAVLGLFGLLASAMLFSAAAATANNPVVQLIQNNPAYAAWMKICILLGLIVIPALLAAGIGLLMLKPWARIISIIYAIYTIVSGLIGSVINYLFLIQPLMQQAQDKQGSEAAGAAIGGAVGGIIGGCVGLIYPVLLLIFMFRPHVMAAFRPPEVPPTTQV